MDRQTASPWVKRALNRRLPLAVDGGTEAPDQVIVTVGIRTERTPTNRWQPSPVDRVPVPVEVQLDPVCVCGEVHRGWQHREAPRR